MEVQANSSSSPQRSPWHSPVPYLFGGLAAMLVLIVFALLILACSYFKFNELDSLEDVERDLESNNGNLSSKMELFKIPPVFEEKYVVIMAGQANPTFLATPVSSLTTSCCSSSCGSYSRGNDESSD
uniref:Protein glutamine dumper 2-like n=1 Tax=Tanacetum cinerariifolium TaxID=118510 RepID=A0A6L2K9D2_TANCI|nr:protein glutamine dumper 2-like [Tanacetum cinerariifolium]